MFGAKSEKALSGSELRQVVEASTTIQQRLVQVHGVLFETKAIAAAAGDVSGRVKEFEALMEVIEAAGQQVTEAHVGATETRTYWEQRYEDHARAGGER